ncbi:hypothetical protein [Gracilimonas mengyeensis]|uniref:DUF5673 domain-containing protein n=1 Tax=Gracilimonas mengyeensis TaxID=1302730 RepID=A0A521AV84_9BACT|nr:hypothetical protein [Gracilimonas mengyeensis]SMO38631.1 hypothetical protein SAMN06265219_101387 [Gracilimonas mengyeensis]
MLWIIVSAFAVASVSIWLAYKRLLYLDQITPRNLSITLIGVLLVFFALQWMHRVGYFPEHIAGAFMANVYASIFGFFAGAAWQQFNQKKDSGKIIYVNRSFWTDMFPTLVAIGIILFGIQRTSLLSDLPVTPIRMTSGLSIIAIGAYSFTIRLVPELREEGLILLDRKISWDDFFTYSWFSEEVVEIEYKLNGNIKSFKTLIPEEDQLFVEKFLAKKVKDKLEKEEFDEYEELDT